MEWGVGSVWCLPPPPPQKKLPLKSLALLGLITSMIIWVIISGPLKCQQKVTKLARFLSKMKGKIIRKLAQWKQLLHIIWNTAILPEVGDRGEVGCAQLWVNKENNESKERRFASYR